MPTFPAILPVGYASIYGLGSYTSPSGALVVADQDFRFGSVYGIYAGGEVFIYGGDVVMFREADVTYRYQVDGVPYTVIPARLATKQEELL